MHGFRPDMRRGRLLGALTQPWLSRDGNSYSALLIELSSDWLNGCNILLVYQKLGEKGGNLAIKHIGSNTADILTQLTSYRASE